MGEHDRLCTVGCLPAVSRAEYVETIFSLKVVRAWVGWGGWAAPGR